jgi:hypothetical protein
MINDVVDDRPLDLSGVSLEELFTVDEPSYMSALDALQCDCGYCQFGSSI